MLCFCSKTYCCYDNKFDEMKFSSKGMNSRIQEESGDDPAKKKGNPRRSNPLDLKKRRN